MLGFPFIFRGALDVRARSINMEMKMAAAQALAALAREDVPDACCARTASTSLRFGRGYIMPEAVGSPRDPVGADRGGDRGDGDWRGAQQIDLAEYREQLAAPG